MRFARSLALLALLLAYVAVGPWVLVAAVLSLAVPRVRRWLRPTWKVVVAWVVVVAAAVGATVVVPDAYLAIPPGPGYLVTPSYVGAPAKAQPIDLEIPQASGLAPNGSSSMHDDAWATDAYQGPGPLGKDPEVDSAWFGLEECATMTFDSKRRIVALCGDLKGPVLHVLDRESLRKRSTLRLPDRGDGHGKKPWENLCGGAYFFLDDGDRAIVATTDKHVRIVETENLDGDPRLQTTANYDLSDKIPGDDCLVALMPDWLGNPWWATQDGRVGYVGPDGSSTVLDLGEEIANSLASDENGVYVVTTEALYQLRLDASSTPEVVWRTTYDRGSEQKPGQLSQGSGTTPTVLPSGMVALTDNADPQMHVQFYEVSDGSLVCQAPVFGKGESASDNSLVAVGDSSVVVENNYGYAGPQSTLLGRTPPGGLARVDADDGTCSVAWTSDEVAPTSVAKVSLETGLVYAYTKRHSWWGVNAWYLTAIDARTGRTAFSVRTGLGTLFNNHYAAVTLSPDGAAYVATLAGIVRVRDGQG